MSAQILRFPDRSAILVDTFRDGWKVEPFRCPAAAGKQQWYPAFVDALAYAGELAEAAATKVIILCDMTGGEAA